MKRILYTMAILVLASIACVVQPETTVEPALPLAVHFPTKQVQTSEPIFYFSTPYPNLHMRECPDLTQNPIKHCRVVGYLTPEELYPLGPIVIIEGNAWYCLSSECQILVAGCVTGMSYLAVIDRTEFTRPRSACE